VTPHSLRRVDIAIALLANNFDIEAQRDSLEREFANIEKRFS
jgi:hypothetical protein